MSDPAAAPRYEPGPPPGEVGDYFPLQAGPVPPGTFEIALVLGGTVSVGAYTAGVVDFLVEALDAWEARKAEKRTALEQGQPLPEELRDVPEHRVVLRVITGTSGGGLNGLLLSRVLNYSFPHVTTHTEPAVRKQNPFYRAWVKQLDVQAMLATEDLQREPDSPVVSLFNGVALERIAREALHFTGAPPPRPRPWVVNDLPVVLTYSNVEGLPYRVLNNRDDPEHGEYFISHADYLRFQVRFPPHVTTTPPPASWHSLKPSDSWVVPSPVGPYDWEWLTPYALGTGAFPLGFPPRRILRPAEHYRFRYVTSSVAGAAQVGWLTPVWSKLLAADQEPADYQFTAMDGGCTDNEPIGLAHDMLSGLTHANPRTAMAANRALILVDPFSEVPERPVSHPRWSLGKLLPALMSLLLTQSRFSTADLSLFLDDSVYSRFLITAKRSTSPTSPAQVGNSALAGSGLGAFLGFVSEAFREHDYLLGRRNAQKFLADVLQLDARNPVFGAGVVAEGSLRPLIPLYGTAHIEQALPPWPEDTRVLDRLAEPLRHRLFAVLSRLGQPRKDSVLRFILVPLVRVLSGLAAWGLCWWMINRLGEAIRAKRLG